MSILSLPRTDNVSSPQTRTTPHLANSFSINLTDFLLTPYRSLWVLFDIISMFWLYTIGIWSSPYELWGVWKHQNVSAALVFTLCFALLALGMGYYERPKRFTKRTMFAVSFGACVLSLIISLAVIYFSYYEVFGRLSLVYGCTGAYLGTAGIRFILSHFLRKNPYSFTILGSSPCSDEIKSYCIRNRREARYYSYVDWKQELFPGQTPLDAHALRKNKVPNLVLAKSALDNPEMIEFALQALQQGCRVIDEVTFYIQFFEKVPLQHISPSWILHEGIDTRPIFYSLTKRLFDVVSSFFALIVLAPFLFLVGLIIKISSPGPVFYIQTRMGRYCQPFRIFKFRTMHYRPEQKEIISTDFKDPRVTKIGRFMRPLHIDELPQLLNVLFGTMSIVGPRPEAYDFAQKMRTVPLYDLRHLLRPGITGHAQITQGYTRGEVDEMTQKLEYDLYYACNSSFLLDIRIILRTIFCLMKKAR